MEVKPGFRVPEKVMTLSGPFNRGSKYKDYVNIFTGQNFLSPG